MTAACYLVLAAAAGLAGGGLAGGGLTVVPGLAAATLLGAMLLRRARRAALTDGRTRTWPPWDPGTAPLISSRLRAISTLMTVRFSVVRRTTPMWPAMRLPGNTRPGV